MADNVAVTQIEITAKDSTQSTFAAIKGGLTGLSNATNQLASQWGMLAGVLGAGTFVALTKSAIDAADKLNDLNKKTGVAVETLGGLSYAAAQSGTDIEAVAKGMSKLSNQMVEAATGGAAATKLFDSMGVSVKSLDGKLVDTGEALFRLADKFASYRDGPEKAALANKIFGDRLGAQLIPLLDEGGEKLRAMVKEYERYGGITAETAARADQFNDTLSKLTLMQGALFRGLASALLPTLQAVADIFVEAKGKGDGFSGMISGIVNVVKVAAIGMVGLVEVFKGVGTTLGAIMAALSQFLQGDIKGAWATLKEGYADVTASAGEAIAKATKLWDASATTVGVSLTTALDKVRAPLVATGEATSKVTSEFEKMARALEKEIEGTLELTRVQRLEAELLTKTFTPAQVAYLKSLAATKDAIDAQKKATEAAVKADIAGFEVMEKLRESYRKMVESADAMVESMEFELKALTMTNAEREIAIKLRELERLGVVKGTEAYEQYAARITSSVETRQALEGQIQLWKDIEGAAHDAFTHIFEGGRSVFDRLKESLKNGLLELLYQMTVKKWVFQISAAVTGGATSGLASASGGGGDWTSLLSSASSASGMFGGPTLGSVVGGAAGFGSVGASFSGAYAGLTAAEAALSLSAAAAAGEVAVSGAVIAGGVVEGLAAGLAAIGPVGWAILAAAIIYGVVSSMPKGGPKTGGFAASGGLAGLNVDSNGRYYTPDANDKAMKTAVDALSASYGGIVKALGGTAPGSVSFALGYDSDPLGKADNRTSAGVSINGVSVYDARNRTVMDAKGTGSRDPEDLNKALALESQRALLAALQRSDIPTNIAKILNSVPAASASTEAINAILALGSAWGALTKTMTNAPLADMLKEIASATGDAFYGLTSAATVLRTMMDAFDGSLESVNNLTSATNAYKTAQVQLLAQLEQVRAAVGTMFGDTIRSLTLQTLDPAAQYQFYQSEIDSLYAKLASATNPADIQKIGDRINQDIMSMFGMLDPASQKSKLPEYLGNVQVITDAVNARLTAIETDVHQTVTDVLAEVSVKLDKAADRFVQAADTQLEAANTPLSVDVRIANPTSEVNQ